MKKKSKKKTKIIFSVITIIVLVLTSYAGFNFYTKNSSNCEVKYSTFIHDVEFGKIDEITIDKEASKVYYSEKGDKFNRHFTTYPGTDTFIEEMLLNNIKVHVTKSTNVFSYATILINIAFIIILIFYIKNVLGNDDSVEYTGTSDITFKDVAGMYELKNDLSFITEMMKNPKYKELGVKIPKGILLEGPPGNGKTLIAKAFAGEAGINFIAVNACDFGSKFIGVGTSKVKKIFQEAKEKAPCVLFIDELDAIGEKRTSASDAAGKEYNTVLTALLNQMDGFTQNEDIIVLAATNRADALDQALLRPGRFDKKFIITIPDKLTRKELFQFYTKNISLDKNVSFDALTNKTYGCSCSEIATIINEAIINSVKNNRKKVSMDDFSQAILETQIKGHIREEYEQTEREKRIVAYHEAGHAIVSHFYCDKKVSNITIKPTTSGAGGFTITEGVTEELSPIVDIKNRIIMCYGGRAAETYLLGSVENASAGASQDIKYATQMAKNYIEIQEGIDYSQFGITGEKEITQKAKDLLCECSKIALKIIREKSKYLDAIAEKLIKSETLSTEEFLDIVNNVDKNNYNIN